MGEFKAIISGISFWIFEKIKLRSYQGQSRLNNFSYRKRNDSFYKKLETRIIPIFQKNQIEKLQKRIFVRERSNSIFYINFALSNRLNGFCVDFGEIQLEKSDNILNAIKNSRKLQRLKPSFWKHDYQYPITKTDKYDDLIINEIIELLSLNLNISQLWSHHNIFHNSRI